MDERSIKARMTAGAVEEVDEEVNEGVDERSMFVSGGRLRRRSITRNKTNFTNKENEKAQTPKAQRINSEYII